MADRTIQFRRLGNCLYRMRHLRMAMETGYAVFRYVVFMYERYVTVSGQPLRLVVAGVASLLRSVPLALDHVQMAALAFDAVFGDKIFMPVFDIAYLKFFFRKLMAGDASADRIQFARALKPFEMAEITGVQRNLQMLADHYL